MMFTIIGFVATLIALAAVLTVGVVYSVVLHLGAVWDLDDNDEWSD